MNRLLVALMIPVGVVTFVALGIIGIGSLLLAVGQVEHYEKTLPVVTALILTLVVGVTATLLATQPDRQ